MTGAELPAGTVKAVSVAVVVLGCILSVVGGLAAHGSGTIVLLGVVGIVAFGVLGLVPMARVPNTNRLTLGMVVAMLAVSIGIAGFVVLQPVHAQAGQGSITGLAGLLGHRRLSASAAGSWQTLAVLALLLAIVGFLATLMTLTRAVRRPGWVRSQPRSIGFFAEGRRRG